MSLSIRLTEPHVFVAAPGRRDPRGHTSEPVPSTLVRGLVVLNLPKRTKITGIEVSLEGHSVTEWPEGTDSSTSLLRNATDWGLRTGIGPRRTQLKEEISILSIKTSLLDSSSVQRRAHSLGPGVSVERDGMYTTPSLNPRPTSVERNSEQYPPRHNRSESVMHWGSRRVPLMQETIPHAPSPPNYSPGSSQNFHPSPSNASQSHVTPSTAASVSPHALNDDDSDNNDIDLGHIPVRVSNPAPHADPDVSNTPLDHSQPDNAPGSAISVISSASSTAARRSRRSARRVSFDSEDSYPVFVDNDDRRSASMPTIDDVYGVSAGASSPASNHQEFHTAPTAHTHVRSPLAPDHRVSASLGRPMLSSPSERTYSPPPAVSKTTPPAPSIPGPEPRHNSRDANDESSRERGRGRGRSSGFGWSVVSGLIREVSQDVADAVDSVRRSSDRSASRGHPNTGRLGSLEIPSDHRREQSFGRGGAGSSSQDRSEGLRDRVPQDRNEARGRNPKVMPLGDLVPDPPPVPESPKADGWTEFSKGTYTYPISFMIPSDSPPSLRCDFGQVSYRLQATVHRAGTFVTKLTASTPVTVISCAGPDDDNDANNFMVQRQWEEKLRYVVNIEGAAFPIGGLIPLNLVLMPLDKISIHQITAHLEERVHYYAHGRTVSRNEHLRRFELLALNPSDKDMQERLLPILSDSPMAAASSPLAKYARPESAGHFPVLASTETLLQPSEISSHLLNPSGPWRLGLNLYIPDCASGIHFTNKQRDAQIVVVHYLKLGLRVSSGVSEYGSNGKKPKMFDIGIEMSMNISSCQCRTEVTHLPAYSAIPGIQGSTASCSDSYHSSAGIYRGRPPDPSRTSTLASGSGTNHSTGDWSHRTAHRDAAAPEFPSVMAHGPLFPTSARTSSPPTATVAAARMAALDAGMILRTEQFARLVAGQESEAGEIPPAYSATS